LVKCRSALGPAALHAQTWQDEDNRRGRSAMRIETVIHTE
jgi:hypothetical protein